MLVYKWLLLLQIYVFCIYNAKNLQENIHFLAQKEVVGCHGCNDYEQQNEFHQATGYLLYDDNCEGDAHQHDDVG